MENLKTKKFDSNEYSKIYMMSRRAQAAGFDVKLARKLHQGLIDRGISQDDARWCVLDAAGRGCFGFLPPRANDSDPITPDADKWRWDFAELNYFFRNLNKTL